MTYEKLMNNENIDIVVFRSRVSVDNPNGLVVMHKKNVTKEMLDKFSYYRVPMMEGKQTTATFVKKI